MAPITRAAKKRGRSVADNSEPPAKRRNGDNSTASAIDFSRLPDNVLKEIIQYLPKAQWPDVESVNHAFQAAVHGAWKSVREIHCDEEFILNEKELRRRRVDVLNWFLEKLLVRAPNIQVLDGFAAFKVRGGDVHLNDDTVGLLAEFGHLERIRFDGFTLAHPHFDACPLTYLHLARLLGTSKSRSKLKELNVGPNSFLENMDHEVTELKSTFTERADLPPLQLEDLTFCGHQFVNFARCIIDMDVTRLSTLCIDGAKNGQQALISLVNRCTGLRRLEFRIDYFVDMGLTNINDRRLLQAIAASPSENLSILKIDWDGIGVDRGFKTHLVEFIRRLGSRRNPILELTLPTGFTNDDGFKAIADHLRHLKALTLNTRLCSTATLKELLVKLERLEKLTIRGTNTEQMDASVVRMANLKFLDMWSWPNQSGPDILGTLCHFDQLKELRIRGQHVCRGVLGRWSKNGDFANLESLTLDLGNHTGTTLVVALLKKMPKLRRLTLHRSMELTDMVLRTIARSCPLLEELDISDCHCMTPQGVEAVVNGCKKLKKIKATDKNNFDKDWARGLGGNKYKMIMRD